MSEKKHGQSPDADAGIMIATNLYIADVLKSVRMFDQELFDEALSILEKWSSGSVLLLASGMSMEQFDNMENKLRAMRSLKEFRTVVKDL